MVRAPAAVLAALRMNFRAGVLSPVANARICA